MLHREELRALEISYERHVILHQEFVESINEIIQLLRGVIATRMRPGGAASSIFQAITSLLGASSDPETPYKLELHGWVPPGLTCDLTSVSSASRPSIEIKAFSEAALSLWRTLILTINTSLQMDAGAGRDFFLPKPLSIERLPPPRSSPDASEQSLGAIGFACTLISV